MKDQAENLISRLKENPDSVLVELYKNYRKEFLSWSFKRFSISEADALDCFQDAIIVFYRNVMDEKITDLSSSTKTYLFSIGKNMVLRKYRKENREAHFEKDLEGIEDDSSIEFRELYQGHAIENRVAEIVKTMRDPCKSILRYFYYRGFTMDEIAKVMKYKNADTVKAQKLRCIREIQNLIQRKMRTEI